VIFLWGILWLVTAAVLAALHTRPGRAELVKRCLPSVLVIATGGIIGQFSGHTATGDILEAAGILGLAVQWLMPLVRTLRRRASRSN
jgi:hypothetical protein